MAAKEGSLTDLKMSSCLSEGLFFTSLSEGKNVIEVLIFVSYYIEYSSPVFTCANVASIHICIGYLSPIFSVCVSATPCQGSNARTHCFVIKGYQIPFPEGTQVVRSPLKLQIPAFVLEAFSTGPFGPWILLSEVILSSDFLIGDALSLVPFNQDRFSIGLF